METVFNEIQHSVKNWWTSQSPYPLGLINQKELIINTDLKRKRTFPSQTIHDISSSRNENS